MKIRCHYYHIRGNEGPTKYTITVESLAEAKQQIEDRHLLRFEPGWTNWRKDTGHHIISKPEDGDTPSEMYAISHMFEL